MNIKSIPRLVWLVPVVLLVVATSRLPYGYYTFTRIVTCGIAGVIAFAGFRDRAVVKLGPFCWHSSRFYLTPSSRFISPGKRGFTWTSAPPPC